MGEKFKYNVHIHFDNTEKLKIIQAYLNEGHSYLEITKRLKDKEGHPIGRWIDSWRQGTVKLTEEERQILLSMGEAFESKRQKLKVYPTSIEVQNLSLSRQDVTISEKIKKF